MEFTIKIETLEKAKEFVTECCKYDENIDVVSGRYVINAKSLLGLLSIDIINPVKVIFHSDNEEKINGFRLWIESKGIA